MKKASEKWRWRLDPMPLAFGPRRRPQKKEGRRKFPAKAPNNGLWRAFLIHEF
jgi:hypothetical protein